MNKKVSFIVSLGGVIASICLFIMFLTAPMPLLVYALPALAGSLLVIIVIEISMKWAFVTYTTVGILSLFTTSNKEAAVLFIMYLGYYPIVKSLFEKVKPKVFEWVLKILSFNIAIIIAYQIIIKVFGMVDVLEQFGDYGKYGTLLFLLFANIVFVVYDIALSRAISSYINWFRPKMLRRFK